MPVNIVEGLTFDDVLLAPKGSGVYSRKNVDLTANLFGSININTPIISANMDTVTEHMMADTIQALGGLGLIHRFLKPDEQLRQIKLLNGVRILTIGVKPEDLKTLERALDYIDGVLIDVAHGHSDRVVQLIQKIKHDYDIPVIAGNVATYQGARDLVMAGADSIKVGVGPGSVCTTRIVTGCGVPQLTAIMEVRRAIDMTRGPHEASTGFEPTLIADGGIRTSGDIVKALAAGADTVMIGSLFAGTDEAPGAKLVGPDGKHYKTYRGMASKNAQLSIGVDRTAEGVEVTIPYKGSVIPIFNELVDGIKSGLSYLNCHSLAELREADIEMYRMSHAGFVESHPHAMKR